MIFHCLLQSFLSKGGMVTNNEGNPDLSQTLKTKKHKIQPYPPRPEQGVKRGKADSGTTIILFTSLIHQVFTGNTIEETWVFVHVLHPTTKKHMRCAMPLTEIRGHFQQRFGHIFLLYRVNIFNVYLDKQSWVSLTCFFGAS